MKRTLGQNVAPAVSPVRAEITAEQWRERQLEAARCDRSMFEQTIAEKTETIPVRLPTSFASMLRLVLAQRGIPRDALPQCLANALMAASLTEESPLVADHVFNSRQEAHRASVNVFARERWMTSLALRYRRGSDTAVELFRNPAANSRAA